MKLLKLVVISLPIIGLLTVFSLVFGVSVWADSGMERPVLVAQADTEENCPNTEAPIDPVEGVYLSTDCGDYCHVMLRLDDGREVDFLGGEEETEGLRPGTRVRLTLNRIQSWSVEPPACVRDDLIVKVDRVR
ncbi:MAG: hypothetical protein LBF58_12930 [Deltaproteobacteria bacterium]|jgi:hypothetical protein|nr:hypothetical protein [Deltaproteobacteria bacterium]